MSDAPPHLIDIDDDDRPVGRVLTRREVLALLGVSGATLAVAAYAPRALAQTSEAAPSPSTGTAAGAAAADLPSCIVRPELTEGPYFVDELLDRSDIRSDPASGVVKEGLPLGLDFLVSRIDGSDCTAFEGAMVDVWHCDAAGLYSDVQDRSFDTSGQKFLRGFQMTDANGAAAFTTIYPGWYSGRTVHIHFKIRSDPAEASGLEFTSQLFFDDEVSRSVYSQPPYAEKGPHDTPNAQDMIYRSGGAQLLLALEPDAGGYRAVFPIGVQMI